MRITSTLFLALILGIFHCSFASSKVISGYIFSPQSSLSNQENLSSFIYDDKSVKSLIDHNLGLFDHNEKLSTASQSLISKLGTKDLLAVEKFNYVFLLEGTPSSALFNTESKKFKINHKSALFNICEDNSERCILKQLFSKENKSSVLNKLKKFAGKVKPEAYLFSNDDQVAGDFSDSRLVSFSTEKGAVFVSDQAANVQYKIASNLESCVNALFKDQYSVDLHEGVVKSVDSDAPVLVFESSKGDFVEFMGDLCSVVGVSTLIRKDPNPSFVAFHISSLGKLEKFVSEEQRRILYEMFNIAYTKFVKNLLVHYRLNEVSGQVFLLNPRNNVQSNFNFAQSSVKLPETLIRTRILAEANTPLKQTSSTTRIIFASVLVSFIFVIVWVCYEMFNMDIQKDSVVYAKFLAADYFRR